MVARYLLVALVLAGCSWFGLEPNPDTRPPECGTIESGTAWSHVDSAMVDATKVYICRETSYGVWDVTWCWFRDEGLSQEFMRKQCRYLHGWETLDGMQLLEAVSEGGG